MRKRITTKAPLAYSTGKDGHNALLALIRKDIISRHPNLPLYAIPTPKLTDKTANGLTQMVLRFLNLSGQFAERISTTGRYVPGVSLGKNVMGQKISTNGKYIPGNGTRGSADIAAVISNKTQKGVSVKIEIKMKDAQSKHQKAYQEKVEAAGGIYLLIFSFEQFFSWYQEFMTADAEEKVLHSNQKNP